MFSKLLAKLFKHSESNNAPLIVLGAFGWFVSMLAQMAGIKGNKQLTPDKKKFLLAQEKNEGICNIGLYLVLTSGLSTLTESLFKKGKILTQESKDLLQQVARRKGFDSIDEIYRGAKLAKKNVFEHAKSLVSDIDISFLRKKPGVATAATIVASIISCNILTPILKNKMAYNALKKEEAKHPVLKPQFIMKNPVMPISNTFSSVMKF